MTTARDIIATASYYAWHGTSSVPWEDQAPDVRAEYLRAADSVEVALRDAGLLPPDDAEARGDYARGRRDAAKAIRLAAEKELVAGNIPSWLRPGSPIYPSAEEARRWVIDWVADIAEHGAITEETP
mgnify:CR=1 FL=1